MPQRHRPRLKQTLIRCDQCGSIALKFYPSRPAVLARISPHRFCSSTCQREHWEARRKAEWVAVVYPCRQCGKTLRTAQAPGRRRDYCSDACKQRAARERSRRNPAGAVVAARERFNEAWRRATEACHPLDQHGAFGAPVLQAVRAHRELGEETEEAQVPPSPPAPRLYPTFEESAAMKKQYTAIFEAKQAIEKRREERGDAVANVSRAIRFLEGPRYPGEPDRAKIDDHRLDYSPKAKEWFSWWNRVTKELRNAYQLQLNAAREATADLRKCKRVAARRAETARLRRAAGEGNPPV